MAKSKLPTESEVDEEPPEPEDTEDELPEQENRPPDKWARPAESYFKDIDWLNKGDTADWALYAKLLRARGNSEEQVIEFCAYLVGSRGCCSPADYLGADQWHDLKAGKAA
jgi:hypothetical protein